MPLARYAVLGVVALAALWAALATQPAGGGQGRYRGRGLSVAGRQELTCENVSDECTANFSGLQCISDFNKSVCCPVYFGAIECIDNSSIENCTGAKAINDHTRFGDLAAADKCDLCPTQAEKCFETKIVTDGCEGAAGPVDPCCAEYQEAVKCVVDVQCSEEDLVSVGIDDLKNRCDSVTPSPKPPDPVAECIDAGKACAQEQSVEVDAACFQGGLNDDCCAEGYSAIIACFENDDLVEANSSCTEEVRSEQQQSAQEKLDMCSSGSSTGRTAGIAIGVVLVTGLLIIALCFCMRRRRTQGRPPEYGGGYVPTEFER
mmetsp:Transcript_50321/g.123718  ORF Transcript_50321/g.123718 Transcript_50321/m.123718 type:complete len:318 (-) Transcript_50321:162-1115(-)